MHTAVQEPLAGGRGRTKQRKKYLPLNRQKLELLNAGEVQGNHPGNPPLALTLAPSQGAIIFMEHMMPALESKASRQKRALTGFLWDFPRAANAKPSHGSRGYGVNGALELGNPSRSQKATTQNHGG